MVQVNQRSANMVHGQGKQQSANVQAPPPSRGGVHYTYSNAAARLKH